MNDRGIGVLEQYDFEVKNMYKGRGFLILDTTKGLKSFREFSGAVKKLRFQHQIQQRLQESGMKSDLVVLNKEGELISKDKDETPYIVREWFDARECNIREEREIYAATEHMAKMHRACRNFCFPDDVDTGNYHQDMREILRRHNREMKKTRSFMRDRRGKTDFEVFFLTHFQEYYEKGMKAEAWLQESSYERLSEKAARENAICHGSYNHHNVVYENGKLILLDFEHCHIDLQMDDLYDFIRKVMEKWDWNVRVGKRILEHYDRILPIAEADMEYLKICLYYPEKFWKIANHYYNSRKSWIPDKTMEKLCRVIGQEEKKEEFLRQMK